MILPDKAPPPPYPASIASARSGGEVRENKLSTLPPHILLHIVEVTFPPDERLDPAQHKRTSYWLSTNLRLVCRRLYIACMHILRSKFIPLYSSLVKSPYTSDPFPVGPTEIPGFNPAVDDSPPILSLQRETEVLDMFIALKSREDMFLEESDLHLEREESFNDLFMLMQPRRRTEDLLRYYGLRYGFITLHSDENSRSSRIAFSRLSISFSSRKVGLVLTTPASKVGSQRTAYKRLTIVESTRDRDEKLEAVARRLAKGLGQWIASH